MALDAAAMRQQLMEESLPDGKPTVRNTLLKMNFRDMSTSEQLDKVSSTIYGFEGEISAVESATNRYWPVTDEVLYKEAKESYDYVYKKFTEKPRVYKFFSTRDAVWKRSDDEQRAAWEAAERIRIQAEYDAAVAQRKIDKAKAVKGAPRLPPIPKPKFNFPKPAKPAVLPELSKASGHISKKNGVRYNVRGVEVSDDLVGTYLNPFDVPKPWITKRTLTGKYYYVHEGTLERRETPPPISIWERKFGKIRKLTQNDDMTGYEYVEDVEERKSRQAVMQKYEDDLMKEIERRQEHPTDTEQIEDVLFDIVDRIHRDDERACMELKFEKLSKIRSRWNVCTLGYKMRKLGANISEDGSASQLTSDLEFSDIHISEFGEMRSLTVPAGLFLKFAEEREVIRLKKIEDEHAYEEKRAAEYEKICVGTSSGTVSEDVKMILAVGLYDPKGALKKSARLIKDSVLRIPRKIRFAAKPYSNRKMFVKASKQLFVQGVTGLLKAARNPRRVMKKMNKKIRDVYDQMNPKTKEELELAKAFKEYGVEEEAEEVDDDESTVAPEELTPEQLELEKLREEAEKRKAMKCPPERVPIKHVDTLCVTFTMLVNPPPHFIKRPPRTLQDDLIENPIVAKVADEADKLGAKLKHAVQKYLLEKVAKVSSTIVEGAVNAFIEGEEESEDEYEDGPEPAKPTVGDSNVPALEVVDDEDREEKTVPVPEYIAPNSGPDETHVVSEALSKPDDSAGSTHNDAPAGGAVVENSVGCVVRPVPGRGDDGECGGRSTAFAQKQVPVVNFERPKVYNSSTVIFKKKTKYDKLREHMFDSRMPPQFAAQKYERKYYYKPAFFDQSVGPQIPLEFAPGGELALTSSAVSPCAEMVGNESPRLDGALSDDQNGAAVVEAVEDVGETPHYAVDEDVGKAPDNTVVFENNNVADSDIVNPSVVVQESPAESKAIKDNVEPLYAPVAGEVEEQVIEGETSLTKQPMKNGKYVLPPIVAPAVSKTKDIIKKVRTATTKATVTAGVVASTIKELYVGDGRSILDLDSDEDSHDSYVDDDMEEEKAADEVSGFLEASEQPLLPKEILDTTLRKRFEKQLLDEIAAAACIPVKNFSIEEIRILPKNDQRLIDLVNRNKAIIMAMEMGASGSLEMVEEPIDGNTLDLASAKMEDNFASEVTEVALAEPCLLSNDEKGDNPANVVSSGELDASCASNVEVHSEGIVEDTKNADSAVAQPDCTSDIVVFEEREAGTEELDEIVDSVDKKEKRNVVDIDLERANFHIDVSDINESVIARKRKKIEFKKSIAEKKILKEHRQILEELLDQHEDYLIMKAEEEAEIAKNGPKPSVDIANELVKSMAAIIRRGRKRLITAVESLREITAPSLNPNPDDAKVSSVRKACAPPQLRERDEDEIYEEPGYTLRMFIDDLPYIDEAGDFALEFADETKKLLRQIVASINASLFHKLSVPNEVKTIANDSLETENVDERRLSAAGDTASRDNSGSGVRELLHGSGESPRRLSSSGVKESDSTPPSRRLSRSQIDMQNKIAKLRETMGAVKEETESSPSQSVSGSALNSARSVFSFATSSDTHQTEGGQLDGGASRTLAAASAILSDPIVEASEEGRDASKSGAVSKKVSIESDPHRGIDEEVLEYSLPDIPVEKTETTSAFLKLFSPSTAANNVNIPGSRNTPPNTSEVLDSNGGIVPIQQHPVDDSNVVDVYNGPVMPYDENIEPNKFPASRPVPREITAAARGRALRNPDARMLEPSYWLAQDLRELNEFEKRQKRIVRLQRYTKMKGLSESRKVLDAQLSEWADDATYFYIEPLVDKMLKPLGNTLKKKLILPGMHYSTYTVKPAMLQASKFLLKKSKQIADFGAAQVSKVAKAFPQKKLKKRKPRPVNPYVKTARSGEHKDESKLEADRARLADASLAAAGAVNAGQSKRELWLESLGEEEIAARQELHEERIGKLEYDEEIVSIIEEICDNIEFAEFIPEEEDSDSDVESSDEDSNEGSNKGSEESSNGGSDEESEGENDRSLEEDTRDSKESAKEEDEDDSDGEEEEDDSENGEGEIDSNSNEESAELGEEELQRLKEEHDREMAEWEIKYTALYEERCETYDVELVDLLTKMCMSIEAANTAQEVDKETDDEPVVNKTLDEEGREEEKEEDIASVVPSATPSGVLGAFGSFAGSGLSGTFGKQDGTSIFSSAMEIVKIIRDRIDMVLEEKQRQYAEAVGDDFISELKSAAKMKSGAGERYRKVRTVIKEMKSKPVRVSDNVLEDPDSEGVLAIDDRDAVDKDSEGEQTDVSLAISNVEDSQEDKVGSELRPEPGSAFVELQRHDMVDNNGGTNREKNSGERKSSDVEVAIGENGSTDPIPSGTVGLDAVVENTNAHIDASKTLVAIGENGSADPIPSGTVGLDAVVENTNAHIDASKTLVANDAEGEQAPSSNVEGEPDDGSMLKDVVEIPRHHRRAMTVAPEEDKEFAPLEPQEDLVGCEISIMVYIDDKLKSELDKAGIHDINPEDVAVMLRQQIFDASSVLHKGQLSRKTLDIKYVNVGKKRMFKSWESFWVHVIHPAFFNYQTRKKITAADVDEMLHQKYAKDKRLPSGILTYTPVEDFNVKNKETFKFLGGRTEDSKDKKKSESDSEGEDEEEDEDSEQPLVEPVETKAVVLDLNVDEFAEEFSGARKLEIFRPNMANLTARDVEKLYRIYGAFEDQYNDEMKLGLVDGKRLRVTQFQAMKDRDTALRVYRTAKMKFESASRKLKDGLSEEPPLVVTRITDEQYGGWVEEIREEAKVKLQEAKALAHQRKMKYMQEAMVRTRGSKQQSWIYQTFIERSNHPSLIRAALNEEFKTQESLNQKLATLSYDIDTIVNVAERQFAEKMKAFQAQIISEEKTTKVLFDNAVAWYTYRTNKLTEFRKNAPVALFAKTVESRDADADEVISKTARRKRKRRKKADEDSEEEDYVPVIPKEALYAYMLAMKLVMLKGQQMAEDAKIEEAKVLKFQARGRRMAKLVEAQEQAKGIATKKAAAFAEAMGAPLAPMLEEGYGSPIAKTDSKRVRRNANMGGLSRSSSSNKFQSRSNSIVVDNAAEDEFVDSDIENELFDVTVPISSRRGSRHVTVDLPVTGLQLGISMKSFEEYLTSVRNVNFHEHFVKPKDQNEETMIEPAVVASDLEGVAPAVTVPPEKEIRNDVAIYESLKWPNFIFDSNDYYYCFEQLPTIKPHMYMKDEISQFAALMVEIERNVTKARIQVAQQQEEIEKQNYGASKNTLSKSGSGTNSPHNASPVISRKGSQSSVGTFIGVGSNDSDGGIRSRVGSSDEAGPASRKGSLVKSSSALFTVSNDETEELQVDSNVIKLLSTQTSNGATAADHEAQMQAARELEAVKRAERVKEAALNRQKREEARILAHVHLYIKTPDCEEPYCIVCKERSFEYWLEKMKYLEKCHRTEYPAFALQYLNERKQLLRDRIERKNIERAAADAFAKKLALQKSLNKKKSKVIPGAVLSCMCQLIKDVVRESEEETLRENPLWSYSIELAATYVHNKERAERLEEKEAAEKAAKKAARKGLTGLVGGLPSLPTVGMMQGLTSILGGGSSTKEEDVPLETNEDLEDDVLGKLPVVKSTTKNKRGLRRLSAVALKSEQIMKVINQLHAPRMSIMHPTPPIIDNAVVSEDAPLVRTIRVKDKSGISKDVPVPEHLIHAGLAPVDCYGKDVVVAEIKADILTEEGIKKQKADDEEEEEEGPDADEGENTDPVPEIMVKVYSKNTTSELGEGKGAYLGLTVYTSEELLNLDAPRGIRRRDLIGRHNPKSVVGETDEDGNYVVTKPIRKGPKVCGHLSIKVTYPKVNHRQGVPILWKMEIFKGTNIAPEVKEDATFPFCEVYWRGMLDKEPLAGWKSVRPMTTETVDSQADLEPPPYLSNEFVLCGHTLHVDATINPVWTKKENNVFVFPPVWTPHDIVGRNDDGSTLTGGGWVTRNHPLATNPNSGTSSSSGPLKAVSSMPISKPTTAAAKRAAADHALEEKMEKQLLRRLLVLKCLLKAEETEREAMMKEEVAARKFILDEELHRCHPYITTQKLYSKDFSRLLQYVQNPPRILERLRFMMGFEAGGGGLHCMCQDPSNYMVVDVLAVPLLYPEDEDQLVGILSPLIGRQSPNILKIFDFSIHHIRGFNATGFTSMDDRMGIIVMERPARITMLQHISSVWDNLSNDGFRQLLLQTATALSIMHSESGTHRNFNPDCVTVQLPADANQPQGAEGRGKSESYENSPGRKRAPKLDDKPVVKVGDFWFLHNPRKAGCLYSMGRADWGSRLTLPPEAVVGAAGQTNISPKSDVYAFGMCVLVWATNGKVTQLPKLTAAMASDFNYTSIVDGLNTLLPVRWGVWVHTLLKMCLQTAPKSRASSQDIVRFLTSSQGKK